MPRIPKCLDRPTTLPAPHHDERGQVAFGFMLLMVVVFMFFALAVDTGIWALDHRTAQNQVDAAAHAGAVELMAGGNATDATNAAREWLSKNGISSPASNGCPASGGGTWWIDVDTANDRVEVCQRRSSEVIFSALTGVLDIKVSASAVAEVVQLPGGGLLPYSLMVMGDVPAALSLEGSGRIRVHDGEIYVRSSHDNAVFLDGSGQIRSEANHVVGGVVVDGSGSVIPPATGAAVLDDPLRNLVPPNPDVSAMPTRNVTSIGGSGPSTLLPGYYPGPLAITGSGAVTFQPGTYVFDGYVDIDRSGNTTLGSGVYIFRGGVTIEGSQRLTGNNVLLYRTCPSSSCGGDPLIGPTEIEGSGTQNLTGHSDYGNVLVWVDRTAAVNTFDLVGSGPRNHRGILYAVNSNVVMEGSSSGLTISAIVRTLTKIGSGTFNINWGEGHAISGGSQPAIALVE